MLASACCGQVWASLPDGECRKEYITDILLMCTGRWCAPIAAGVHAPARSRLEQIGPGIRAQHVAGDTAGQLAREEDYRHCNFLRARPPAEHARVKEICGHSCQLL